MPSSARPNSAPFPDHTEGSQPGPSTCPREHLWKHACCAAAPAFPGAVPAIVRKRQGRHFFLSQVNLLP